MFLVLRLLCMLILAVVASVTSTTAVTSRSNDPSTFFGGDAGVDIQDYLDWVGTVEYQGMHYMASDLDPTDGAAIHWNINQEQGFLELAVVAHATGWLGFGISDNGGMLGADMLIFEATHPTTIQDAHVTDVRYPKWTTVHPPGSWLVPRWKRHF
jgi:hypothetical protein